MSSHAQPLVPARSAVASPAGRAGAGRMGIGRFAFTPVWPLMAHDAALSLEQGGWLASANYAGYLLGALIAAAWPPRRPLAALGASLLAVAALTLAMPLPHSVAGWAALRLAAGWASALGFICVASWRPARAGDPIEPAASAVVYAGVGAGIAATGLACGPDGGRRHGGAMLGGAGRAGAGLVDGRLAQTARGAAGHRRVRPPIQPGTAAARHGGTGVALRRVRHRLHHSRHLPARHGQEVMPDPAVFGWAWPLFGLAAALSCLMVPKLARRHGEIRIWRGAQAAMALGMAVAALRHDLAAVIVAALLVGGTFMVITRPAWWRPGAGAARPCRRPDDGGLRRRPDCRPAAGRLDGAAGRQPAADAGGGRGAAGAVGLGLGENHGRARAGHNAVDPGAMPLRPRSL